MKTSTRIMLAAIAVAVNSVAVQARDAVSETKKCEMCLSGCPQGASWSCNWDGADDHGWVGIPVKDPKSLSNLYDPAGQAITISNTTEVVGGRPVSVKKFVTTPIYVHPQAVIIRPYSVSPDKGKCNQTVKDAKTGRDVVCVICPAPEKGTAIPPACIGITKPKE